MISMGGACPFMRGNGTGSFANFFSYEGRRGICDNNITMTAISRHFDNYWSYK
jgi:hypothetical protein